MNTTIVAEAPDVVTRTVAYTFGIEDALRGALCVPEMWFYRRADKCAYAEAFASVNGHTLTTRQILGEVVK